MLVIPSTYNTHVVYASVPKLRNRVVVDVHCNIWNLLVHYCMQVMQGEERSQPLMMNFKGFFFLHFQYFVLSVYYLSEACKESRWI